MANNRFPVFFLSTTSIDGVPYYPAEPPHRTSPKLAFAIVGSNWARFLNPDQPSLGIVLLAKVNFAEIRERFRKVTNIPQLLPPQRPISLDLSYPAAYQESNGAALRRRVWASVRQF